MSGTSAPAPARAASDPGFDVVAIGAGLGIYALTRAYHEAYGTVTTVLAANAPEPLRRSVTSHVVDLPAGADDAARVARLVELAQERPAGRPAVLLCNSDGNVEFVARNAEVLSQHYALRYPSLEVVERLADKASFAEVCTELGIDIPATEVIDFRDGTLPELPALPFDYPVVAKPAQAEPHVHVRMPGKKKIYPLHSAEELRDLISRLHAAGFRNRFVVQEMIPGDDTSMLSLTAYRSASGTITLMGGARVLLEEHTPEALGRPAAMITQDLPEQFAQMRRILDEVGYVGFANADIKVDPRDGVARFLEINPRIGRNSYYVTGGGANVAEVMVADAIEGRDPEPRVGLDEVLYSIVPFRLLLRYITDPQLAAQVKRIARARTVNPWRYRAEGLWLRGYSYAVPLNHIRKFRRHYPEPSADGF